MLSAMDDPLNDPNPARSPEAWAARKKALMELTPEQRKARFDALWAAMTPGDQAAEIAERAFWKGRNA